MAGLSLHIPKPALVATLEARIDGLESEGRLSLFYKPTKRMTVGGELIYGRREVASGANDNATRLQPSVQVNF